MLLFAIGCAPNPNGSKWIKQIKKENILSIDIQINSCGDFEFYLSSTCGNKKRIKKLIKYLRFEGQDFFADIIEDKLKK